MIKSFTIAVYFILSLFFSLSHASNFKCLAKAIKYHLNTMETSHIQKTFGDLISTRSGKTRFQAFLSPNLTRRPAPIPTDSDVNYPSEFLQRSVFGRTSSAGEAVGVLLLGDVLFPDFVQPGSAQGNYSSLLQEIL